MQTLPERLQILHDPVSYFRPWVTRQGTLNPVQRSAANAWICQTRQLPGAPPDADATSALASRLIRGWQRLPATAWLLACARHRRHVLGARWLPSQPPPLHAFLRLGFADAATPWPQPPTPEQLLAWGGRQLQEGLHDPLPAWLHARMALWFAGLPALPAAVTAHPAPFDMTCFLSAWTHAADLS
ncbi:hypothetical protein ABRP17_007965 [Stenotrophomonas sp. WHRI 8082]|uniref:hypothetical protein n=1 Tax=Stenotrophomonas sp. WHRI 8082 TaxID=3162571 RepID=UPI0032ED67C4